MPNILSTLPRLFRSGLILAGVGYAALAGFAYFLQDRLLYVGASMYLPSLDPAKRVARKLTSIPDAAHKAWAWVAQPKGRVKATVLFFHGNSKRADKTAGNYASYFTNRGYRVVFAEYPGYGFREGVSPTHDVVIADAKQLIAAVRARYRESPLWVAGESLGAGIAAQVAAEAKPERVLLFTPWYRLSDVAAEDLKFLPVQMLLNADYDSCKALAGLAAKTYITYAEQDWIIPAHHARSLIECLHTPPGHVIALPGIGHNHWARTLSLGQWDELLAAPGST